MKKNNALSTLQPSLILCTVFFSTRDFVFDALRFRNNEELGVVRYYDNMVGGKWFRTLVWKNVDKNCKGIEQMATKNFVANFSRFLYRFNDFSNYNFFEPKRSALD